MKKQKSYNMSEKEKEASEKVLKKMKENKELYNYYPRGSYNKDKFTAMGLSDLAGNHLFDDLPELFDITKHQGHVIRAFFQNKEQHEYIIGLYKEFPGFFEGESKRNMMYGNTIEEIVQNEIPLF